jgi:2-oxoglutarate ferredoxin oxidoreductase subunit gamma
MRNEIRIVGSGGQGVILSSILLAHALGIYEGREIAQTQSYGPEARGGACKGEVVVSSDLIDYMKVGRPDIFIAFNEVGFHKYISDIADGAFVLINETLVKDLGSYKDNCFSIRATELAEKELKPVVTNIVMMGALARVNPIVSFENLTKAVMDIIPHKFHSMNLKALELGYNNVSGEKLG